jgi:hypothetical protein
MGTLQFRGRAPDSDFHVVHKKYVDDRYKTIAVDSDYINSQIFIEIDNRNLVKPKYVDDEDVLLAHKATVDSNDTKYLLKTELGQPNGVASLDSGIYVPPEQLPPLQTARDVFFKNADTIFLSGTKDVTQIQAREFKAAELTIPDLGYPYLPLLFAVIQGGSPNAITNLGRAMGTGNYAQISILHTDKTRRSFTVTSGQRGFDFFTCMPSPESTTLLSGANTFELWLGMQTGTTFTFKSEGLRFWCMAFPGL